MEWSYSKNDLILSGPRRHKCTTWRRALRPLDSAAVSVARRHKVFSIAGCAYSTFWCEYLERALPVLRRRAAAELEIVEFTHHDYYSLSLQADEMNRIFRAGISGIRMLMYPG